jgi:ribosomal-protein-alanine N-acetyltransferase
MIETKRLVIKPLSYNDLIKHVKAPGDLASDLGLKPSESLIAIETQEAILNDLLPNLSDLTKNPLFYTMWIIIEKNEKAIIGGICFHGEPDERGEVEIGFGIDNDYRNKGYMTETISGLINWIHKRDDIKTIKALTDKTNQPSIQVLKKNNFKNSGEDENFVTMKYECNQRD